MDTITGFFFDVDTYIFFRNNVSKEHIEALNKYDDNLFGLIELAQLDVTELKRLLKCILKSPFINNDIKTLLTSFKDSL
jgi:hypothetical protein